MKKKFKIDYEFNEITWEDEYMNYSILVDTENKTFRTKDAYKDDYVRFYNEFEYRVEKNPTKVQVKLINKSMEQMPEKHSVLDGKMVEPMPDEWKEMLEWHDLSLGGYYEAYFFILNSQVEIIQANFDKMRDYVGTVSNYELMDLQGYGMAIYERNKEEGYHRYDSKEDNKHFFKKEDLDITPGELAQYDKITSYINALLLKPKRSIFSKNKIELKHKDSLVKSLERRNLKTMMTQLFLTPIIAGIIGSMFGVGFWESILYWLLLYIFYHLVIYISGYVQYKLLGAKSLAVESILLNLRDKDYPIPDSYQINNPVGYYSQIALDPESENDLIIASTIFSSNIEFAQKEGLFMKAKRLRKVHQEALLEYSQDKKHEKHI
jgi:hypothetical protein